jgi:hypothetical protein
VNEVISCGQDYSSIASENCRLVSPHLPRESAVGKIIYSGNN